MSKDLIALDHYGRIKVSALPAITTARGLLEVLRNSEKIADSLLQRVAEPGVVLRRIDDVAQDIRAEAEAALSEIERLGQVRAEVAPTSCGLGWVAKVTYATTGRDVPRAADEGGEHRGPRGRQIAAIEAEIRATRVTHGVVGRHVRFGYAKEEADSDIANESKSETVKSESGQYVQLIGRDGWGLDGEVTEEEHESAIDRMQAYLDEHPVEGVSAGVVSPRRGEIEGIYRVEVNGNERLLPHPPETIRELYEAAWQRALDTWPGPGSEK